MLQNFSSAPQVIQLKSVLQAHKELPKASTVNVKQFEHVHQILSASSLTQNQHEAIRPNLNAIHAYHSAGTVSALLPHQQEYQNLRLADVELYQWADRVERTMKNDRADQAVGMVGEQPLAQILQGDESVNTLTPIQTDYQSLHLADVELHQRADRLEQMMKNDRTNQAAAAVSALPVTEIRTSQVDGSASASTPIQNDYRSSEQYRWASRLDWTGQAGIGRQTMKNDWTDQAIETLSASSAAQSQSQSSRPACPGSPTNEAILALAKRLQELQVGDSLMLQEIENEMQNHTTLKCDGSDSASSAVEWVQESDQCTNAQPLAPDHCQSSHLGLAEIHSYQVNETVSVSSPATEEYQCLHLEDARLYQRAYRVEQVMKNDRTDQGSGTIITQTLTQNQKQSPRPSSTEIQTCRSTDNVGMLPHTQSEYQSLHLADVHLCQWADSAEWMMRNNRIHGRRRELICEGSFFASSENVSEKSVCMDEKEKMDAEMKKMETHLKERDLPAELEMKIQNANTSCQVSQSGSLADLERELEVTNGLLKDLNQKESSHEPSLLIELERELQDTNKILQDLFKRR